MIDEDEVMERQDAFVTDIVEEYGDQLFYVSAAMLLITLTDLHYRIEKHGLSESVPVAMADTFDCSPSAGDVEIIVRWFDADRYLVGVYPIFPGE